MDHPTGMQRQLENSLCEILCVSVPLWFLTVLTHRQTRRGASTFPLASGTVFRSWRTLLLELDHSDCSYHHSYESSGDLLPTDSGAFADADGIGGEADQEQQNPGYKNHH